MNGHPHKNKALVNLDVDKEDTAVNSIFNEKDFEKKKVLVVNYINTNILASKKRPLYLQSASRARTVTDLDSLTANLTLAGRGCGVI